MKITIFLIICITFILSGCKSTNRYQPGSISPTFLNNFHRNQFIDFLNQIEKKDKLTAYQLTILDKISFTSDTIIYYESILKPTMITNALYFSCSTYESDGKKFHSYKSEITTSERTPIILNPLSTNSNISYINLEETPTYSLFKSITKDVKDSNWEKVLIKGKKRSITSISYYKNMLLVAIKIGGIYKIRSYKDILPESKGFIEVRPLNAICE